MAGQWINVSAVEVGRDAPTEEGSAINGGLWHNYIMFDAYDRSQRLGIEGEPLDKWLDYISKAAQAQPSKAGQATVGQIANILKEAQAQPDSSIDKVISSLGEVFEEASNNPEISKDLACLAGSVAYRSGQFWSEITLGNSGAGLKLPGWLGYVCADVSGALDGGAAGAAIGALFGGSGAGIGAIIGGILGGAAGSLGHNP